jgi:hypothetical protein
MPPQIIPVIMCGGFRGTSWMILYTTIPEGRPDDRAPGCSLGLAQAEPPKAGAGQGRRPQNLSGSACCTCGSARTAASTSAGQAPRRITAFKRLPRAEMRQSISSRELNCI